MPAIKRLSRILLNAATVLSLVLCVATVVLWVRSFAAADIFAAPASSNGLRVALASHDGLLVVHRLQLPLPVQPNSRRWEWDRQPDSLAVSIALTRKPDVETNLWAFRAGTYLGGRLHLLVVRQWVLLAVTGLLPACRLTGAIWQRANAKRSDPSLCPTCAYDLRATPDRCPECGAMPKGVTA